MIAIATENDIPALLVLINRAYRGEISKKGWTTEANLLKATCAPMQKACLNCWGAKTRSSSNTPTMPGP